MLLEWCRRTLCASTRVGKRAIDALLLRKEVEQVDVVARGVHGEQAWCGSRLVELLLASSVAVSGTGEQVALLQLPAKATTIMDAKDTGALRYAYAVRQLRHMQGSVSRPLDTQESVERQRCLPCTVGSRRRAVYGFCLCEVALSSLLLVPLYTWPDVYESMRVRLVQHFNFGRIFPRQQLLLPCSEDVPGDHEELALLKGHS